MFCRLESIEYDNTTFNFKSDDGDFYVNIDSDGYIEDLDCIRVQDAAQVLKIILAKLEALKKV